MVRTPWYDKNGMKKGAWSEEEDNKLRSYIEKYGTWNWRLLPIYAGLSRCGKSCRLRWINYLRPNVKRGNYSREEEDIIMTLHGELGNRWAAIAAKLPGRTDNEIKNYWHTHLKKRAKRKHKSFGYTIPISEDNYKEQSVGVSHIQPKKEKESAHEIVLQQQPSSDFSSPNSNNAHFNGTGRAIADGISSTGLDLEPVGNFWTDPFLVESDTFITHNLVHPLVLGHGNFCPSSPINAEEFLCSSGLPDGFTTFY